MNHSVIDIQGITKTYVNGKLTVPVLPVSYTHLDVYKRQVCSRYGP